MKELMSGNNELFESVVNVLPPRRTNNTHNYTQVSFRHAVVFLYKLTQKKRPLSSSVGRITILQNIDLLKKKMTTEILFILAI